MSHLKLLIGFFVSLLCCQAAFAQTTSFTYQGRLSDGGTPATGIYEMQFKIFDTPTVGTGTQQPQAAPVTLDFTVATGNAVSVTGGVFTVVLDFGAAAFPGANRFLEIAVRRNSSESFVPLSQRQPISSTPYAVRSLNASSADSVNVSGVPPGSSNYIQNTTSQQAPGNFNIIGSGTVGGTLNANVVNATTQFSIGGQRILSNAGSENLFAGAGAGEVNTGIENAFFGRLAGNSNQAGSGNSFYGFIAGRLNVAGSNNSFFGSRVGFNNSSGNFNSFFGHRAGENNNGSSNSFFGTGAGLGGGSGGNNTFLGHDAGNANGNGSFNTIVGDNADVALSDLTNATAIGANALVSQSNSLVLGGIKGVNGATENTNVGIGTSAPAGTLHVNVQSSGNPINALTLDVESFQTPSNAVASYFFKARDIGAGGTSAFLIRGDGNVGIGTNGPQQRLHVDGNEILSTGSSAGFKFRTRGSTSSNNDWVWYADDPLGDGVNEYAHFWKAGLGDVVSIFKTGWVRLHHLRPGGDTFLCFSSSLKFISECSSSLRYKTNIAPFSSGLNFIRQLRPITFDWKDGGKHDIGFGAEDVARVDPLFVTYNDKGEVEGVKYDRLSVAFVNAFKEQQAQIEQQQKLIEIQQQQMEALKKLVCATNRDAGICKQ